MKMNKKHFFPWAFGIALFVASCTEEAVTPSLTLTADKTTVSVGEPVTFHLLQDVQALSLYTGDAGHDYYKSGAYVLRDVTDSELSETIYRPEDTSVKRIDIDMAGSEPGSDVAAGGALEVRHATQGNNLIGTEAAIVYDELAGQNVLRITSIRPDWWYEALRINLNSPLGTDRNLKLTMRFDYPSPSEISTGNPRPDVGASPVVIRLAGKGAGDTEPIFCEETVWDIFWMPTDQYATFVVDLGRVIPAWEAASGRLMEELTYAQILFTATGNVGYVGNIYLSHVSFSDRCYKDFDYGFGISLPDGPGTIDYVYTYSEPGTYRVTAVGTNASYKNYSADGYKKTMDGQVSASEYDYARQLSEMTITVTP